MEERPSDREIEKRSERLHRAAEHPVRQEILKRLRPRGATLTAADLETDELPLSHANYHLTFLEEAGAVEVAETMHEGPRVVRVFRSTPAGDALASAA